MSRGDQAVRAAAFFRRQPSKPKPPSAEVKSGSAAGIGVALTGAAALPMPALVRIEYPDALKNGST